jgi:hypothetical protein
MSEVKRRLIEQVIDPSFVEGLSERSIEDLKTMRDQGREVENEVSFERRLCQARIDILSAELDRRAGKIECDLISRLPQILADEPSPKGPDESPLPQRPPDFSAPRSMDVPRRRVEELVGEQTLARLPELPEEEIKGNLEKLAEHERNLSSRRKKVHEVLDQVQGEIIRRYTSGETDTESLIR